MTIAEWVNGLTAMPVVGVVRNYSHPPTQLSTAQMPCVYPRFPLLGDAAITFNGAEDLQRCTIELVYAIKPVMQGLADERYTALLALMDNVNDALITSAVALEVDRWSIAGTEDIQTEGTVYWLLVVRVEGSFER